VPIRQTPAAPASPNVGFDRLREAGFTDDDIANFRLQFHGLDGYLPEEGMRAAAPVLRLVLARMPECLCLGWCLCVCPCAYA
jgi:hypothetical protein